MSSLHFRSVRIGRMPGIANGYEVTRLAPGLNIVFGPNASGKSTTVRAIESLLWPRVAPAGASLEGRFIADGEWWIELEGDRVLYQREGSEAGRPVLPSPEDRDRYRLSLHELLEADGAGFARAIAMESAGGYDLAAAAGVLNPRTHYSRPRRETEELNEANRRLDRAVGVQRELTEKSRTLEADEERLANRAALQSRRALLELALEYAAQVAEVHAIHRRLDAFPVVLERLHGNEADELERLRAVYAEANEKAIAAKAQIDDIQTEIDQLALPPAALDLHVVRILTDYASDISTAEREANRAEEMVARQRTLVEEAARPLGGVENPEKLAELSVDVVDEVLQTTRDLEEIRADRLACSAELSLLEGSPPPGDRASLERATMLLQQWLGAPEDEDHSPVRTLATVAAIALTVFGLLGLWVHPAAGLAIVAGVVILLLVLRQPGRIHTRAWYRAEFESIAGIDPPVTWDHSEVQACLGKLNANVQLHHREVSDAERRARLRSTLESLARKEEPWREALQRYAAACGIPIDADHIRIGWTIEQLGRWQKANAELKGAEAALDEIREQRADLLDRANSLLRSVGLEGADDSHTLVVRIKALDERVRTHARCSAELRLARMRREGAANRALEASAAIDSIIRRLDLQPGEEALLSDWCARKSDYLQVRRALDGAEAQRDRLAQRIRQTPGHDPTLLEEPAEVLSSRLAEVEESLEELVSVHERVIELRSEIARVKEGHEVEEALAERDRCVEALRTVRARDVEARVAAILVEYVERANRDRHLPDVFHRASALFARITHGHYTLKLENEGESSFRAYDTVRGRSQPLDELSSATRLQLLLAVRVAFVEAQESGLRLPLLMDETLANSDDERAVAIMRAVVELAREGRQIFYFTAQPDEVRKWRAVLKEWAELPTNIIDLGEARRLENRLPPEALEPVEESSYILPAPDGCTLLEYGQRIGVPRVDLFGPVTALHLWYLLDDPELLYNVMSTFRIERWGHLQALFAHGAGRMLGKEGTLRITALADAAQLALTRLQIGKGRPLTRDALMISGAVTDTFIDRVDDLRRSVDNDAARLIAKLENREVKGFRAASLDALRVFLEENNYLDTRDPIRLVALRIELIASMSSAIEKGHLSVHQIDDLLVRLFHGLDADLETSGTDYLVPDDQSTTIIE